MWGLWEAKQRYGNPAVQWVSLIQPSIDLCRNGIEVLGGLAGALEDKTDYIKNDVGLRFYCILYFN